MGRRHARQVFMPNLYVFPGGRVDRSDARISAASPLRADVMARLRQSGASAARAHALAVAAVRETFEEAGLIVGASRERGRRSVAAPWRGFLDQGLAPALAGLSYIFHAITPPGEPRRFNTRFFMARAEEVPLAGTLESRSELADVRWVPIEEALGLPIPWVTGEVLKHVRGVLSGAAPDAVPFYRRQRGRDIYGSE